MRARLRSSVAMAAALSALSAIVAACGARTGLLVGAPPPPPRSSLFCARAEYQGGSGNLTLLILLDRSLSMQDSGKWAAARAAIAAFIENPNASGLAVGLQYLPLGLEDCTVDDYAHPSAPVGLLPANVAPIETSLASTQPGGDTPILPALQGVMEYARGLLLADPSRSVAVALITDGQPDSCGSTIENVAKVAAAAAGGDPPVLTFVTALEDDQFAQGLDTVAAAGGSGRAIRVSDPATAAQQLVDSLASLRDSQRNCRYGVPSTGAGAPTAQDIAVGVRDAAGSPPRDAVYVSGAAACSAADAFWVDDPAKPAEVTLCPSLCARVHASAGARIDVTAGCGPGAPEEGGIEPGDAGCPGITTLDCQASCDPSSPRVEPVCAGGDWACPAGSVDYGQCAVCPAVPHGCCEPDGTIDDAQCIDSQWRCPPGATFFGQGACRPPAVCAPGMLLPCPLGQLCTWSDHACGTTRTAGTCAPVPQGCPGGGPSACGCDGATYASVCAANEGGVDVSTNLTCTAPAGAFACGPLFCDLSQICQEVIQISKSVTPQSWACVAPPAGCTSGCGCGLCPPATAHESCLPGPGGGRVLACDEP